LHHSVVLGLTSAMVENTIQIIKAGTCMLLLPVKCNIFIYYSAFMYCRALLTIKYVFILYLNVFLHVWVLMIGREEKPKKPSPDQKCQLNHVS
jgi:uncharacterized membrane protein